MPKKSVTKLLAYNTPFAIERWSIGRCRTIPPKNAWKKSNGIAILPKERDILVRKRGQQARRRGGGVRRKIAREDKEKSVEGARTILRILSLSVLFFFFLVRKKDRIGRSSVGRTIGTVELWERGNESKENDATWRKGNER